MNITKLAIISALALVGVATAMNISAGPSSPAPDRANAAPVAPAAPEPSEAIAAESTPPTEVKPKPPTPHPGQTALMLNATGHLCHEVAEIKPTSRPNVFVVSCYLVRGARHTEDYEWNTKTLKVVYS